MSALDVFVAAHGLQFYNELPLAIQPIAQASFLADQEAAFRRLLGKAREARATQGLHDRVNDQAAIWRAVGSLSVLRRWQRDPVYLVKCIEGNLTYFYADGRMHRFMPTE